MKYLTTLLLAALSLNVFSQNNSIHVYPWNPDANQDNSIGMGDMLSFLSVFGEEFGNPPEPCDYDGTPLEEWWGQVISGDITVDSVFTEFQLVDSNVVFSPGCPDPTLEIIEYVFAEWMTPVMSVSAFGQPALEIHGNNLIFQFAFDGSNGTYRVLTLFPELSYLGFSGDGFFGGTASFWSVNSTSLPFSESWFLDEEGIHIESGWDENDWPYYANYLHLLPYWHYADE